MARAKRSAAYMATAVAPIRAAVGRMSTAAGRWRDTAPLTCGFTPPPAKIVATATTWHSRFIVLSCESFRHPRVACLNGRRMRGNGVSGLDRKSRRAGTEAAIGPYACRRSVRANDRRSRSALRRSGWRSSSEMGQVWEQNEQHQQSVTSEPLMVCSGRTEPIWWQDGHRSGIRSSSCTYQPYQASGQRRRNGAPPL